MIELSQLKERVPLGQLVPEPLCYDEMDIENLRLATPGGILVQITLQSKDVFESSNDHDSNKIQPPQQQQQQYNSKQQRE